MFYRLCFALSMFTECHFCHASGQHIREIDRQLLFFSDVFFETGGFEAKNKDRGIIQVRGSFRGYSPSKKGRAGQLGKV